MGEIVIHPAAEKLACTEIEHRLQKAVKWIDLVLEGEARRAWTDIPALGVSGLKIMATLRYCVLETALAAAQCSSDPWRDWASFKDLGDRWLADALDVLAEKAPRP